MFHSRGTVQSNTGVPVGTSCLSSGTTPPRMSSVCLTPSARDAPTDRVELRRERIHLLSNRAAGAAGRLARQNGGYLSRQSQGTLGPDPK